MHAPYRWRSSVCTGYISCLEVVDKFSCLCWFFRDDGSDVCYWTLILEPTTSVRGGIASYLTLVGSVHPSIWTCIQWFQREHAIVTTVIQQDAIGTQPTKRINQKQVMLQKRLQNLCNDRISGRKTVIKSL
jgi:hypothetical protein